MEEIKVLIELPGVTRAAGKSESGERGPRGSHTQVSVDTGEGGEREEGEALPR